MPRAAAPASSKKSPAKSAATTSAAHNFNGDPTGSLLSAAPGLAGCPCGGGCPRCVGIDDSVRMALASPGSPVGAAELTRLAGEWPAHLPVPQLHTGADATRSARLLGARAYQTGSHIVLDENAGRPGTAEGDRIFRHELAHVAQTEGRGENHSDVVPPGDSTEIAASAFASRPAAALLNYGGAVLPGLRLNRDSRLGLVLDQIRHISIAYTSEAKADLILEAARGINLSDLDNLNPILATVHAAFEVDGDQVIDTIRARVAGQSGPVCLPPASTALPSSAGHPLTGAPPSTPARAPSMATASSPESPAGTSSISLRQLAADFHQTTDAWLAQGLDAIRTQVVTRAQPGSTPAGGPPTTSHSPPETSIDHAAEIQQLADAARITPVLDQGSLALTGFGYGFLDGAQAEIPPAAFAELDREIRTSRENFDFGNEVGIAAGVLRGIRDALEGLLELTAFFASLTPESIMHGIGEAATQARDLSPAFLQLAQNIQDDPVFFLIHGNELGRIAGHRAGRWFTDDFMRRSTFDKGETIGEIEGRIMIEIAMLFLGPEELVARGGAILNDGIRVSSELGRAMIEIMEHIPALRRILEARGLLHAAEDTAEAGRALRGAGHAVDDLSHAAGGARDATHAADALGETTHAMDETTEAIHAADDAAQPAGHAAEGPATVPAGPTTESPETAAGFHAHHIRRLGSLLGRPFTSSELGELARVWRSVANAGEDTRLTLGNSRQFFENQRRRFWRAVRGDADARRLLTSTDAGLVFEGRADTAPFYRLRDGSRVQITIDHITERQTAPTRALDPANLRLSTRGENTVVLRLLHDQDVFQNPLANPAHGPIEDLFRQPDTQ